MKAPKKTWAQKRLAKTVGKNQPKIQAAENSAKNENQERLTGCALERDGVEYGQDKHFRSHAELRGFLGDEDRYKEKRADRSGFWTNKGRFVTRYEASYIAADAGQASPGYRGTAILSGDIDW